MLDSKLTVPDQLELTPGMVRMLLHGVTAEQLAWKPAPDRFSIAEVLAHLAHAERYGYLPKYRLFAQEDSPALEAYDTDGMIGRGEYSNKDGGKSMELFEQQRRENLILLRSLTPDLALRSGRHSKVGQIQLRELLNECAYHDLGHIRQLAELVRAQRYHPEMGRYARHYQVSP